MFSQLQIVDDGRAWVVFVILLALLFVANHTYVAFVDNDDEIWILGAKETPEEKPGQYRTLATPQKMDYTFFSQNILCKIQNIRNNLK